MRPVLPRVTVWADHDPDAFRALRQTAATLDALGIPYRTRRISQRPRQTGTGAPLVTVEEHEADSYWWWTGYDPRQLADLGRVVKARQTP